MIQGKVAPGWEGVQAVFASHFGRDDELGELGAALCVRQGGEDVVDLWGGHRDPARTDPWNADTLVNSWSTTKGVAALAVALLVEGGAIDYRQRVSDLWPEYAAAGKAETTVAQLMSHRAGLTGFAAPTTTEDLYDWDRMCAQLAAQTPVSAPGTATCYHTITFGFLAGELVRRVTGRSVGRFVADEIAGPRGADYHIGLPAALDDRVANLVAPILPEDDGPPPVFDPPVLMALTNPALDVAATATSAWRRAELPALNGHGSARGIARLYDIVAVRDGGFAEETVAALGTIESHAPDMVTGFDMHWGRGVSLRPGHYGPGARAMGHGGWGGSIGGGDRDTGLSIGYVCNRMGAVATGDPRGAALLAAIAEAAR